MRQALLNLTTCKVFNASQRLQVPEDLRVSGPLVEDGVERPRLVPVDGRDPIGPLDFEEGLLSARIRTWTLMLSVGLEAISNSKVSQGTARRLQSDDNDDGSVRSEADVPQEEMNL